MYAVLKGPRQANFLLYVLKTGVPTIILIPIFPEKNVLFISYINLMKVGKQSSKYSYGNKDSLKLEGDFPVLTLTILKLNA